jgi:heterodisulfide reductase subunit A
MPSKKIEDVVGSIVIVGGGISGIQAALDLADSGFKVHLVEESPSIGGIMAQLDKTFPTNDCSLCILAPKMIDCFRHPNIAIYSYSTVEEVTGTIGNFKVKILTHPRYVHVDKCTGCGSCIEKCPIVNIPNEFDAKIGLRKAIFFPFPQAIPKIATIDPQKCLFFTRKVCRICEKFCQAEAIDFEQKLVEYEVNAGAIILAPGLETFDTTLKSARARGYGRYKNVITSVEFERILSASGPFSGHVQRPSDGVVPRKIAFIQCVGSRDVSCGHGYCSSVCCMYAIKEAVIAKEHVDHIEPTIFYIDIRAFGKDFDKYVERAKNQYGLNFIRGLPEVYELSDTNNLKLVYEADDGNMFEEIFDLVVLSVGLQPTEKSKILAEKLGIELDEYGFCKTKPFLPVHTSKPGIFACGTFSSPKDIPESIAQGSAAAACAGTTLTLGRGSLVETKKYPEETFVTGHPSRIGVFVCHCGINIGGVVDIPSVVKYVQTLPNVAYVEDDLYTCSSDTQEKIKEKIHQFNLNRIIVASCTPRTHEALFQETIREAGLNKYLFEMANIRDQCSWVHMSEPEAATEKAKDLIRMAVTKSQLLNPLERLPLKVTPRGLVIGGGVAGMNAALALAQSGFETYIVEKEPTLGGFTRNIRYTVDGLNVQEYLHTLIENVYQNELITTFQEATIESISGYVGNFKTMLSDINGIKRELEHGIVIVATGGIEYLPTEYCYGDDPKVITQSELEVKLAENKLGDLENIVMIQCVGSRDERRQYCSRVCCTEAIKNALKIKEKNWNVNVFVLYRDIRTYGLVEDYYQKARDAGVLFIRYDQDKKPVVTKRKVAGSKDVLELSIYDPMIGNQLIIEADLLVLSVAIVSLDNKKLAQILKIPLNEDGFFLEAHSKIRPVDFATDGVFLCGLAHSPQTINESITQAYATVSRASTILSKESIEAVGTIATINSDQCITCLNCEAVCEYNAITVAQSQVNVNPLLCKGCGTCAVECPAMAITMNHFTDDQLSSMIRTALEPKRDQEGPNALAFFCTWCAYAGADLAGVSRFQYPPTIRIIRVMCTGRIDEKYILQALLLGADGVLIGGCHHGDCHYSSGNRRAEKRVQRVHQWLKQAGVDPDRLRLEWVSAGEGKRLAEVMTDFTQQLEKLGPSPLRPLSNASK